MKGRLVVALTSVVGALLLFAPTASAGSATLNFPLSGNSDTTLFSKTFECCDISFSAGGIDVSGNISGGISLDMATSMNAPTHNDLAWTDANVKQGANLDLTNTFNSDPGSFNANYTLGGDLNIYGFDFSYSKSAGDTLSCGLPLLSGSCSHTTNVTLFSFNLIDIGVAYFQINVVVPITTTANINGDGVSTHRTVTVLGNDAIAPADLSFNTSPQLVNEGGKLSCRLPAGNPVIYAMGNETSHVNGSVTEGVGIGVNGSVYIRTGIFGDVDVFDTPTLGVDDLFSLPPITFNQITLTAPGQNVSLGNLLKNDIAPTVAMGPIPADGQEGKPIQLTLQGTGPGGSMSPCGNDSLDIDWEFDDGAVAFGPTVNHTWADNLLGNAPRSGEVTITDPTGLSTILNFSVPVANVAPTVSAGLDKQAYWGDPVAFHANGADQGPVDAGALTYSWNFNDPASPNGATGADVSHTFSMPSSTPYVVNVTATDNDGATGNSSVNVTILKHDSTLAYTGATSSVVTDANTLKADLTDAHTSQRIAGRKVDFYVDGAWVGSAATDNNGTAAISYTPPLGSVGSHCVVAKFAGDPLYNASASGGACPNYNEAKNQPVLTYTGPLQAGPSKSVTLTAKLADDLGRALAGKVVNFTLGSQTCNGQTTDGSGNVSCTIAKLTQNPGQYAFQLSFGGDGNYNAVSVSNVFHIGNK